MVDDPANLGRDAVPSVGGRGEDGGGAAERVALMHLDAAGAAGVEEMGGQAAGAVRVDDVFGDADGRSEHARVRPGSERVDEAAQIARATAFGREPVEVGP